MFFERLDEVLIKNNNNSIEIIEGLKEEQIRESWEPALSQYKEIRHKYLIYN